MKTVGILGGFGPETTAQFQLKIVDLFREKKLAVRPSMIIFNTPIFLQIENDLINNSGKVNNFIPFLINGIHILEKSGADFLVLPCNTLHVLLPILKVKVDMPFMDLIQETTDSLKEKKVDKIAIIATEQTIKSNMHQNRLKLKEITPVVPTKIDQEKINRIISDLLDNKNQKKLKEDLRAIIKKFHSQGIKNILLACTDLQLIFPNIEGVIVYDTLDILAKSTVKFMLDERR